MEKMTAWEALPGQTPDAKLGSLGIERGRKIDIRMLDEITRAYEVAVYLFFEEDLVRLRSLESVIDEYSRFADYERPYISVESFLRFTRENDPSFERTMQEFPLTIEIVNIGLTCAAANGKKIPFVSGLMPFLEDLDFDADPLQ
jgi:hypothetical protein